MEAAVTIQHQDCDPVEARTSAASAAVGISSSTNSSLKYVTSSL